uniref:NADH dehydrogenase subunit 4 n=1 Tax=Macropsidius duuschulus TaxID=2479914 RepID=UPI002E77EA31|nr:NADH dehydrogenase subunit 4 [Macropsidius duuschulus]WRK21474.1 NADH dehydrogenase subunit 4 [Macropsidius duuschulus]
MMGYLFSMFFSILLVFLMGFYLFQYYLIFCCLLFIFMYTCDFYCNLSYLLGFDNISLGLILLTFLILNLMIFCSLMVYKSLSFNFFLLVNYMLLIIMVIFFCSLSIFYFYVFFEFSLIPLVFLIMGWGYQPERLLSSLYLFFYTLFGSLPFLVLIIYIYYNFYTMFFDLIYIFDVNFIFHFFMIFSFLIKLPMFILHFWLPKAHVQAPVSGSMILAGVLLKIGGYGLIRIFFVIENSFYNYSYVWYSFSIYGSLLVSLICFVQGDLKCLIAYSSVSHMGLCLLGLLTMSFWGVLGSYYLMISHGLCSSCLFMMSNFYYERIHSRSFYINKGLINFFPSVAPFWLVMCCFNMGCPPSLNFISEIMILNSMVMYFNYSFIYFLFISFFCSCFSFFLFSYVFHGFYHSLYSLSFFYVREYLLVLIHLIPLFFIIFFINIFI